VMIGHRPSQLDVRDIRDEHHIRRVNGDRFTPVLEDGEPAAPPALLVAVAAAYSSPEPLQESGHV
jgi:hypothetical protein